MQYILNTKLPVIAPMPALTPVATVHNPPLPAPVSALVSVASAPVPVATFVSVPAATASKPPITVPTPILIAIGHAPTIAASFRSASEPKSTLPPGLVGSFGSTLPTTVATFFETSLSISYASANPPHTSSITYYLTSMSSTVLTPSTNHDASLLFVSPLK